MGKRSRSRSPSGEANVDVEKKESKDTNGKTSRSASQGSRDDKRGSRSRGRSLSSRGSKRSQSPPARRSTSRSPGAKRSRSSSRSSFRSNSSGRRSRGHSAESSGKGRSGLPRVGEILRGEVKTIAPFGAFVKVEGYEKEGLLHISCLRDYRVGKVEDCVRIGDRLWVKVRSHDRSGTDKYNLDIRTVDQKTGKDLPSQDGDVEERGGGRRSSQRPGRRTPPRMDSIHEGKVAALEPFGAFVRIEGYSSDGLLHISRIRSERIDRIQDFLSIGDRVTVRVCRVDEDTGKYGLDMRDVRQTNDDSGPRRDRRRDGDPMESRRDRDDSRERRGRGSRRGRSYSVSSRSASAPRGRNKRSRSNSRRRDSDGKRRRLTTSASRSPPRNEKSPADDTPPSRDYSSGRAPRDVSRGERVSSKKDRKKDHSKKSKKDKKKHRKHHRHSSKKKSSRKRSHSRSSSDSRSRSSCSRSRSRGKESRSASPAAAKGNGRIEKRESSVSPGKA